MGAILFDGETNFKELIFKEIVQENNPEINSNSIITFQNCIFKRAFILEKIKAKEISFIDCIFEKECVLSDSEINIIGFTECNLKINFKLTTNESSAKTILREIKSPEVIISGNYQNLQIVGSTIQKMTIGDINDNSSKKDSKIEFLVDNNIEKLTINPFSTYSSLSFHKSIYDDITFQGNFYNDLVFKDKIQCKGIYFESSVFTQRIDFEEGNFDDVNFYRSSFDGLIHINDFKNMGEDFHRDLVITKLCFHSCTFDKDVSVSIEKIESLDISNNNFKQLLNFDNRTINTENMVMISINRLNRGSIVLERAYFDLWFSGINFGDIFIKDSLIWNISLSELNNKGSISLTNVKKGKFFTIHNSNSGNLHFINTNINNFEEIIIADSNLDGLDTSIYPTKVLSYSKDERTGFGLSDKSKNRQNLKNVYNQLKQITKKKQDIHMMFKYRSLEYKNLLLGKKINFDTILLSLNWLSNNNGKSWFRGILFTLVMAFLFYWLYISSVGQTLEHNLWWKEYILFISSFPSLNLEKYETFNSEWYASLIIWLGRIFISYGIYQTVAAFRKYGKA
ncbi:MAG: hypothetical protein AAF611_18695 [Bacteroidota bacterium]